MKLLSKWNFEKEYPILRDIKISKVSLKISDGGITIDWKRKPSRHWPARKQLSKDYEIYEPH